MSKSHRIFTTGGPTQVGGGLYIERQADSDLLEHCRNGEYAFVLSSRQVGKSSLMNNVTRQLKAMDGIESVIIDLQRMGAHLSADQWYQGLLTRIARRFRPEMNIADWWQTHSHLGHADRFSSFLRDELLGRCPERIVIFVDEIDTTLSLNFADDFFLALRAMYNTRDESPEFKRLSFVLIGVATPGDLINDQKRSPFNIGKEVALDDFTFDEASPLAAGFGLPKAESRLILGWVMKWTNGHPLLTQQVCRAIAEQGKNHWNERQVDDLITGTFFGAQAEQNIHLKAVRDLLTQRAPKGYEEAMLKTYREVWQL
jgi:hypothetical protein